MRNGGSFGRAHVSRRSVLRGTVAAALRFADPHGIEVEVISV